MSADVQSMCDEKTLSPEARLHLLTFFASHPGVVAQPVSCNGIPIDPMPDFTGPLLSVSGGTSLFEAFEATRQAFLPSTPPMTVEFTDGPPDTGGTDLAAALAAASRLFEAPIGCRPTATVKMIFVDDEGESEQA